MRSIKITLSIICFLFTPLTVFSADVDTGQIIEASKGSSYIQVNDRVYKVGQVDILTVEGRPSLPGTASVLAEGDIVTVVRGTWDKEGFWNAELVTLYRGEIEKQKREEMELPVRQSQPQSIQQPKKVKKQKVSPENETMTLENGVWKN